MSIDEHIAAMLRETTAMHAVEVDYQRAQGGSAFVVAAVREDQDSQLAGAYPSQDQQSEIAYSIALADFRAAAVGTPSAAIAAPVRGDKIRDPAGSDGAWQVVTTVHREANRQALRVVVRRGGEL